LTGHAPVARQAAMSKPRSGQPKTRPRPTARPQLRWPFRVEAWFPRIVTPALRVAAGLREPAAGRPARVSAGGVAQPGSSCASAPRQLRPTRSPISSSRYASRGARPLLVGGHRQPGDRNGDIPLASCCVRAKKKSLRPADFSGGTEGWFVTPLQRGRALAASAWRPRRTVGSGWFGSYTAGRSRGALRSH
jgi:hypothetical protein